MKLDSENKDIADYYFGLDKHLSVESKLELIIRLADSLKSKNGRRENSLHESLVLLLQIKQRRK
jgi:hypothetical protein